MDRKYQAKRVIKPGRGWLQSERPGLIKKPNDPHFKGAMVLDRDYKKGRRLWLSGWMYENERGKVMYFLIANLDQNRAFAKRERLRKAEEQRKHEEKMAKRSAPPKVLKREDVI